MIYTSNILGVVISAVGSFIIGFLWFGPLFGKTWTRLMGFTQEQMEEGKRKGMAKPITISIIISLISAFVFFSVAESILIGSFGDALMLGILLWLGYTVPTFLNAVLWEGRKWGLFWIQSLQVLASLIFTALVFSWMS